MRKRRCKKCGKMCDDYVLMDICGGCGKPIVFEEYDAPMRCCDATVYCGERCCPYCDAPFRKFPRTRD